MVSRRVVVTGRVQGVNYRAAVARGAEKRGVAGWVVNHPDGAVEAVLQGDEGPVDALIEGMATGPPAARVERVTVTDGPLEPLSGFEIR